MFQKWIKHSTENKFVPKFGVTDVDQPLFGRPMPFLVWIGDSTIQFQIRDNGVEAYFFEEASSTEPTTQVLFNESLCKLMDSDGKAFLMEGNDPLVEVPIKPFIKMMLGVHNRLKKQWESSLKLVPVTLIPVDDGDDNSTNN